MTFSFANLNLKKAINSVDWKLLLFLLLFLDVKLGVKVAAIIIIYLLQFNFRFGFSLKNSRLPLFYLLIIVIAFVDLFITKSYGNPGYLFVFLTGIAFWILCLLAIHQVKLSVENNGPEIIHRTILVFFVINAALSFYNIAHIIWETGAINPYKYQGEYQKYFIGTGDYIKGLTFDTSTTNAVLNAFGVIYFLTKKNPVMVLICMAVLLLTGSNFTNLVLGSVLAILFLFKSSRDQKSLIVICLMFLVVFMAKISPQNNRYVFQTIKNNIHPQKLQSPTIAVVKKTKSILTPEQVRRKIAQDYLDSVYVANHKNLDHPAIRAIHTIPKTDGGRIVIDTPNINAIVYQSATDTTTEQRQLLTFIGSHKTNLPLSAKSGFTPGLPGKVIGLQQTVKFLQHHPVKIIAGDGMGNFSSKLAFKATTLGFAGGYPSKYAYISNDFLLNHLDLYLNFFSKRFGLHSLINSPYSVYDQLLAEYGLLGLLAFAICYLGFFSKHFKKLTYGIPILVLMMAFFFIDYWFEQLSVLVFFELLLLLNIKETTYLKPAHNGH